MIDAFNLSNFANKKEGEGGFPLLPAVVFLDYVNYLKRNASPSPRPFVSKAFGSLALMGQTSRAPPFLRVYHVQQKLRPMGKLMVVLLIQQLPSQLTRQLNVSNYGVCMMEPENYTILILILYYKFHWRVLFPLLFIFRVL